MHVTYVTFQTPLHHAARIGLPQCIQILLEHGAQTNIENGLRETAEHLVAGKPKSKKIIEYAVAKHCVPRRTKELQNIVVGK